MRIFFIFEKEKYFGMEGVGVLVSGFGETQNQTKQGTPFWMR